MLSSCWQFGDVGFPAYSTLIMLICRIVRVTLRELLSFSRLSVVNMSTFWCRSVWECRARYALALCRTFRVRLSGVVLGSDCNEVPRITVVDTLWSGCSLLREWGGDSPPPRLIKFSLHRGRVDVAPFLAVISVFFEIMTLLKCYPQTMLPVWTRYAVE